jgi:hypothetical protein
MTTRTTARLGQDVADPIGRWYLNATSTPNDPVVVAAYEHLQAETDRLFDALVRGHGSDEVRVIFTNCLEPYAGDAELIAAVRASRVLEVTTAAVSREPIHPLLDCTFGGPFDRFRAVHDLIGHVKTGFGFDLDDEIAAWHAQDRIHGHLARRALATELLAINSARSVLDEAPSHKAVLLEPELLGRSRALVAHGQVVEPAARTTWPTSDDG